MAGPMNIFDIAGRAMSAQLVRLNATASNMANAGTVTGDAKSAYRAIKPVFETVTGGHGIATVKVDQVVKTDTAPVKRRSEERRVGKEGCSTGKSRGAADH